MNGFVTNEGLEAVITDGLKEGLEFEAVAFGHQFDAAIGEIADGAADIEAGGDLTGGVAEADALHVTRKQNQHALTLWTHGRAAEPPEPRRRTSC
jgi:hypothetical protein